MEEILTVRHKEKEISTQRKIDFKDAKYGNE